MLKPLISLSCILTCYVIILALIYKMYPKELEIKEKLEKASSLPFLEIYLKFYINAQLSTRLYDKRDHFNFAPINFLHFECNIPMVQKQYTDRSRDISQLLRYTRASCLFSDFLQRRRLLGIKLLSQGLFKKNHLILSFIGKCRHLVEMYSITTDDERWYW